jgi:hypothetical protein
MVSALNAAERVGFTRGRVRPLALRAALRAVQNCSAVLSNRRVLTGHPLTGRKNKGPTRGPLFFLLAERVGFEPTLRGYRKHAFQAGAFSHSATSPDRQFGWKRAARLARCGQRFNVSPSQLAAFSLRKYSGGRSRQSLITPAWSPGGTGGTTIVVDRSGASSPSGIFRSGRLELF